MNDRYNKDTLFAELLTHHCIWNFWIIETHFHYKTGCYITKEYKFILIGSGDQPYLPLKFQSCNSNRWLSWFVLSEAITRCSYNTDSNVFVFVLFCFVLFFQAKYQVNIFHRMWIYLGVKTCQGVRNITTKCYLVWRMKYEKWQQDRWLSNACQIKFPTVYNRTERSRCVRRPHQDAVGSENADFCVPVFSLFFFFCILMYYLGSIFVSSV